MHYCLMILTNEFPNDDVISKILEPYNCEKIFDEESAKEHVFAWDYWKVGGRYKGKLKLKFDPNDDSSEYRWMFLAKEPRAGRLFRSLALENVNKLMTKAVWGEDDFYFSMGARDGYIYVDGGKISDMLNFQDECLECYCAIDTEGNVYGRKHWNGSDFIKDDAFEDKIKAVCENMTDGFVTFVDIHK